MMTMRKLKIYEKGKTKVRKELDVVSIISKMRRLDLISDILLTDSQKILLNYQKKNLLKAEDSSDSEDDLQKIHLRMIGHQNIIARSTYYMQLRVLLERYKQSQNLEMIDKKIMIGFFNKNLHRPLKDLNSNAVMTQSNNLPQNTSTVTSKHLAMGMDETNTHLQLSD
jgi:hypothetical protein